MYRRIIHWALGTILIATSCLAYAMRSEYIVVNRTTSVTPGVYVNAPASRSTHVTFCLGPEHKTFGFYGHFCSPDNPEETKILKAINARKQNGSLIVKGRGIRPIDSNILGPISKTQIVEHYRIMYAFKDRSNRENEPANVQQDHK